MDVSNLLQTVAEISIAFAGFSGLFVALRKNPGPLTPVQKFRLKVLLSMAFGALFLSFMPDAVRAFGVGERAVWLASSAALMLYSFLFNLWWAVATGQTFRAAPEIFNWYAYARMLTGHMVVIGLQALGVAARLQTIYKHSCRAAVGCSYRGSWS